MFCKARTADNLNAFIDSQAVTRGLKVALKWQFLGSETTHIFFCTEEYYHIYFRSKLESHFSRDTLVEVGF